MRKKFFIGMAFVALGAGFFGIRMANQPSDSVLTPLQMRNLEALADGESNPEKKETCYKTITSESGLQTLYCATCTYIPGAPSWVSGTDECPK